MVKVWNNDLVQALDELETISKNKGEVFRARAYKTASDTLLGMTEDITDIKQVEKKIGLESSIYRKLKSLMETGKINEIEKEKGNVLHELCKIYGIGPKKAADLSLKVNSIDELRQNPNLLNNVQKIGLKYFDEIQERIPRAEIDEYNTIIKKYASDLNVNAEIVGSYRRGAMSSGDIDIIMTSEDKDDFKKFMDALIKDKVVIEVLSRGKTKSLTIGQIGGKTPRRIDFLHTSHEEYAFAVLYFTGSKAFNTVMRGYALSKGHSLNEHGMQNVSKDVKFESEKDIFNYLDLEFREPTDRKDGTAVVVIGEKPKVNNIKEVVKVEKSLYKCHGKAKGSKLEGTVDSREEECSNVLKAGDCKKNTSCVWKKKKNDNYDVQPEENIIKVERSKLIAKGKSKTLSKKSPRNMKYIGSEFNPDYKNMELGELVQLIRKASNAYYNSLPIMTDVEFDILRDYVEEMIPDHPILKEIGAPIKTKAKVKLPYFMASMNKVKPPTLKKWLGEYDGPYCVSAKLDGVSGLFTQKNGKQKLYTRGNGEIGQDISNLIPYIESLSRVSKEDIVVRGELIIPEKEFQDKYSKTKSNSRNTVSGLVNSKTIQKEEMKAVHFVVYEVIMPSLKPGDQFVYAKKNRYELVQNEYHRKIDLNYASNTLQEWRKSGKYTIDGIILAQDEIYERKNENPKHAVAFKMVLADQVSVATVTRVTWSTSKHGLMKPVIQIEPVNIGGVVVKNISGQNARFIVKNGIGIGAVIEVTRRGDVIPYVEKILKVSGEPSLPDGDYEWTATNIDIIVAKNDESREQLALAFFKGMEVDGIGIGVIKKFNKAGFKTIPDILSMTKKDILKIDGFKEKSADKFHGGITKLVENNFTQVSLGKLMGLSGAFGRGFGERKNNEILKIYPDILVRKFEENDMVNLIKDIHGFSLKTATQFVEGLPRFKEFSKDIRFKFEYKKPVDNLDNLNKESALYQKSIVFTGGKDKVLIDNILKKGGILGSSVSSKTFAVITSDLNSSSSKLKKAVSFGIPIYTAESFRDTYFT